MLKYITEKLIGQILPSVVATVLGAYVVNQYINKPNPAPAAQESRTDVAKPAAAPAMTASFPEAEKADFIKADPAKSDAKAKTADKPSVRHGIARDKAAAEKAAAEKAAAEKLAAEKAAADKVAADKAAADKALAEKAQEERREAARDPNDVVRAAVERLRASEPSKPVTDVAARVPEPLKVPETVKAAEPFKPAEPAKTEAFRVQDPPRSTGALQPLPPPVNVAGPAANPVTTGSGIVGAASAPRATVDASYDAARIAPPADIPTAHDTPAAPKPSVAEDVLFAAKSVFHAVLPR